MTILIFLTLSLATWRISTMLVHENGPAYVFERMRYRIGLTHSPDNPGEIVPKGEETFLTGLFSCVYCLSIWVGAFWAVLFLLWPTGSLVMASPFAFSGVSILIEEWREWQDHHS